MLSQISSSLDSPTTEVSSSVTVNSSSVSPTIGLIRKNKGWNNLKPAKKGEKRNPSGKRKGTKSTVAAVERMVTTQEINAIARSIIDGAVAGKDSKQDRFLKMRGELIPPQSVPSNNNTYTVFIDSDTIQSMRQFVKDRQARYGEVIDISAIPQLPISSSIQPNNI
jgi:hypothetical protein